VSHDARERLKTATEERERLRRAWEDTRNSELLRLLVLTLPRLLGAERCGVFVASSDGESVWLEAGTDLVERQIVVGAEDSMVGEVLRSGEPLIRSNLEQADGAHQTVGERTHFIVRDAIATPIRSASGARVLGVLQCLNRVAPGTFGEADIALLREVAFSIQRTIERIHGCQSLLDTAGALDVRIGELDRVESAIRGGRMFRTFEPAEPLETGGFLHHRWRNVVYPPFIDPRATQTLSESWDTDANDVFLCSHQKVGTHLAKKFLVELARELLDLPADHPYSSGDIGHDTVPWPEVMYSQHGRGQWKDYLARTAAHTRLWYIHCGYGELPFRSIHPRTRFVVVVRDPRAVAVSQYFFWKRHPLLQVPSQLDLDSFARLFINGDLYFGDYHRHVLDWIQRSDERVHPGQILVLRYEDLVLRKEACCDALVSFLAPGRTLSPDRRAALVQTTEFNTMKKEITQSPGSFHLDPQVYFRAGRPRDWEQHLSPESIAAIDEKSREVWGGDDPTCPPLSADLVLSLDE